MLTWHDVKVGPVSLAEIVRINDYLDMVSDIEYFAIKDEQAKHKRRR